MPDGHHQAQRVKNWGEKDGASQRLDSGVSSSGGGPSFSPRDPAVLLRAPTERIVQN